ncbi:uncharacterized protein LOC126583996 [Malus sylvestris]|uniref:uncharacterized protein LOC126583996 n=1 Tax=Malus sylvestris TaxID=3752 RepID=UPI0021AC6629|nr:uncharacterized protein LOC126583996 [Malus sylvestris]
MIHPLKGCNMWPKCNMDPLLPPLVKKQPGRPKKARKKDPEMEKKVNDNNSDSKQVVSRKGKTIQCHKCWGWGHNQKFCKNEPRDAPQGVYVDKRWAYSRPETGGKKKRQSSGSSAQRSGTSTTVGNEDQVMNQHTTVVQVDVGDVVHSSDGGPAPKKSKLIARRNNPKQALYCDPHEATKVQDNSQLTITRGVRGATFTTIPRVEMPQGRVGSSNPMTGVFPHPPTITEGAKGATFTTIPRVEMPQSRFGSSSPKTGWPPHPPTTSKQTVAPWKPPGKSFVHKNQNLW